VPTIPSLTEGAGRRIAEDMVERFAAYKGAVALQQVLKELRRHWIGV
jgi:hypothetical protein